jgi:LysM repeat protein
MCGHDLRTPQRRRQRVSWIDALLVLAVLAVLAFWWRIASQPRQETEAAQAGAQLLPTNIPVLTATLATTMTVEATVEPTPTDVPTPVVRSDGVVRHTVRAGETLLGIAGLYGVTVSEIQAANNLQNELIRAGDELFIPITRTDDEEGEAIAVASQFEYTVEAGDTIVSIASRFGSTVEDIQRANSLSNNAVIRPGQVLAVPVRQVPSEVLASSAEATPTPPASSSPQPFVTPGETIYIEPRLIGPPDDAVLNREEAALLRWISVDVLDPNEWYVLLVYPVSGSAQTLPSIWTKATSYRLDVDLAPAEGEAAEYAWQVSVVRVKPGVSSQFALEAASPPSELRSFTWR